MIHKLLYIKNCGRFLNCTLNPHDWDGVFSKINTIYAENGSGKTTLTQIFKSMSGNDVDLSRISKKASIHSTGDIEISFMAKNKQYIFKNNKWNNALTYTIETYDSYYAESNIYTIPIGNYTSYTPYLKLFLNDQEIDFIKELKLIARKRRRLKNNIRTVKEKLKEDLDSVTKSRAVERLSIFQNKLKTLDNQKGIIIKQIDILIGEKSKQFLNSVNSYLEIFNHSLKLVKLEKRGPQLIYNLQIDGKEGCHESSNISLKHSLSEGDKSSLSLSFFLAKLDFLSDLKNTIIIFDDPISSFDSRRRNTTISILSRFAEKSLQFFLLSHDLNFVKAFYQKTSSQTNLKIEWQNGSSSFVKNALELELMTGVTKDIYQLQQYITNGAKSDFERRDIARCIRPAIEGVFRIKYFSIVKDNEWLGDFLGYIRDSATDSPLNRLKGDIYDTMSDINEYSQKYHHSNPQYLEERIYDHELRQYVKMTLNVMMYI